MQCEEIKRISEENLCASIYHWAGHGAHERANIKYTQRELCQIRRTYFYLGCYVRVCVCVRTNEQHN